MEEVKQFTRAGKPWGQIESQQLVKEYNVDKLNLLEICNIHKRMPGGITSRLRRLNLVDMKSEARGFSEYQQSDLYKQICIINQEKFAGKSGNNKQTPIVSASTPAATNNTSDIAQLKKDMKEIKENIDKILELMNAVYQFETTNEESN
jgi:hypothetical protein